MANSFQKAELHKWYFKSKKQIPLPTCQRFINTSGVLLWWDQTWSCKRYLISLPMDWLHVLVTASIVSKSNFSNNGKNVQSYCKTTFIRVRKFFACLTKAHCRRYFWHIVVKKPGVDNSWSRKLVGANQFISDRSRNKVVANNGLQYITYMYLCCFITVRFIQLLNFKRGLL